MKIDPQSQEKWADNDRSDKQTFVALLRGLLRRFLIPLGPSSVTHRMWRAGTIVAATAGDGDALVEDMIQQMSVVTFTAFDGGQGAGGGCCGIGARIRTGGCQICQFGVGTAVSADHGRQTIDEQFLDDTDQVRRLVEAIFS